MNMDVACLGILVADIFASPIDALPQPGQLKIVDRFLLSAGGCATNTAAGLSRLGRKVKVLGKVGKDLFGDFVLEELRRLGVDTSSVKRSETHPTSSTCIINVQGEDRRYLHSIGANADFSLTDVDGSALDGVRALYVGGYLAMPSFSPQHLIQLFESAKDRKMMTILDVVIPAGSTGAREQVREILKKTDVFLPNDDEAHFLTGRRDPQAQADCLAQFNPDCTIVITQGPQGALVRHGGEVLRANTFKVDAIDGSGAGDAFAAGFITGMLENWPLEYTLRFASAVGASCTRSLGCIEGVFHFDEALAFVEKNSLAVTELQG